MTNEEFVLLCLISQSQFGVVNSIDFSLVDMDRLYEEALQQSVLGLVAYQIPSEFRSDKWLQAQFRQKSSYILYCYAQDELKDILNKNKIPFVILKGNASAVYYEDPSKRSMGDIDFLVPQDKYEVALKVLEASGYIRDHETDRHISYRRNNFFFELHNRFSHDIDIEDYITDGFNHINLASIEGFEFPMLSNLANGLVLIDHLRSHIKSTVGIRQVIDWMMYVYRTIDDDFWYNEFQPVVREKGIEKFVIVTTRMCQLYLGLPDTITWCSNADEILCARLMDIILVSGNFGRKNGIGKNVELITTSIRREGLFHRLQQSGEYNWEAYHNHNWLKPFCWFYQIFRYAKQGFKSGRNSKQLKNDLDRSQERAKLLKELEII